MRPSSPAEGATVTQQSVHSVCMAPTIPESCTPTTQPTQFHYAILYPYHLNDALEFLHFHLLTPSLTLLTRGSDNIGALRTPRIDSLNQDQMALHAPSMSLKLPPTAICLKPTKEERLPGYLGRGALVSAPVCPVLRGSCVEPA